jgi:diacylglycerol diphosphate phosphatase / phosphatidate phosphatase
MVLLLLGVGVVHLFKPVHRYLPDNDPMMSYPLRNSLSGGEIVPPWALAIVIVLPLIFFLPLQHFRRSAHDLFATLFGWAESVVLALFVTEMLKRAAGRYRPDFDARLASGDQTLIVEGEQSFPSGHSSLSFAVMSYVAMWSAANLGVFHRHGGGGELWKAVISLAPLSIAFFVAISRTIDNHHNFSDVLAGGVIGAAFGVYCWLLNYPMLSSKQSAVAKLREGGRRAADTRAYQAPFSDTHFHEQSFAQGDSSSSGDDADMLGTSASRRRINGSEHDDNDIGGMYRGSSSELILPS